MWTFPDQEWNLYPLHCKVDYNHWTTREVPYMFSNPLLLALDIHQNHQAWLRGMFACLPASSTPFIRGQESIALGKIGYPIGSTYIPLPSWCWFQGAWLGTLLLRPPLSDCIPLIPRTTYKTGGRHNSSLFLLSLGMWGFFFFFFDITSALSRMRNSWRWTKPSLHVLLVPKLSWEKRDHFPRGDICKPPLLTPSNVLLCAEVSASTHCTEGQTETQENQQHKAAQREVPSNEIQENFLTSY